MIHGMSHAPDTSRYPARVAPDGIERTLHGLRIAEALLGLFRHCSIDESLPMGFFGRQARYRILGMHQRQRQRIRRIEWQFSGQQFVSQNTEAVKVRAPINLVRTCLLRAHLRAAANRHTFAGNPRRRFGAGQGDTEIRELRPVGIVEQHVLGFDIAMDDPACMGVVESIEKGTQQRDQSGLVVAIVANTEVALGQIRHDVVEIALLRAAHLVDDHDTRMLQLGDDARLVLEALRLYFVELTGGAHHLDRHFAIQ